jgi:hypothetical protein
MALDTVHISGRLLLKHLVEHGTCIARMLYCKYKHLLCMHSKDAVLQGQAPAVLSVGDPHSYEE